MHYALYLMGIAIISIYFLEKSMPKHEADDASPAQKRIKTSESAIVDAIAPAPVASKAEQTSESSSIDIEEILVATSTPVAPPILNSSNDTNTKAERAKHKPKPKAEELDNDTYYVQGQLDLAEFRN